MLAIIQRRLGPKSDNDGGGGDDDDYDDDSSGHDDDDNSAKALANALLFAFTFAGVGT